MVGDSPQSFIYMIVVKLRTSVMVMFQDIMLNPYTVGDVIGV